ncbi:M23 family metallopeptidase [Kitasatospora sp. NPDC093806]|uniref:murein hydrolase activator EnvC family protein n=1 Tax=Kitasatospora sp. NPDC093806 TaxID=3155075 RepID=UPI00341CF0D8
MTATARVRTPSAAPALPPPGPGPEHGRRVLLLVLLVLTALLPTAAPGPAGHAAGRAALRADGRAAGRAVVRSDVSSGGAVGRVWPVDGPGGRPGAVVGRFDAPATPWAAGHRGVDLAATPGAEVRAAAAGVVTFAGPVAGRPVVTVTHPVTGTPPAPPLRTTYLPVDGALPVGTAVAAGQVIGRLTTGAGHCADGPCLHWGLLRGRRYLDPPALLGLGTARLLPLGPRPAQP